MKFWSLTFLFLSTIAFAHVGSPDVYYQGDAGPYHLLITVRPPAMVPGVAQIEVRTTSGSVSGITIVPVYLTALESGYPPSPDSMERAAGDPQSFTGRVWLMASGSWEIRIDAEGSQGRGQIAVPVPSFARRTLPMQRTLGVFLLGLMVFLSVGMVSIAGAAAREGVLDPGVPSSRRDVRHGRLGMVIAGGVVLGILALGNWWWNAEAAELAHKMLYQSPTLNASLAAGNRLLLQIEDNYWHQLRKESWSMRLIPDHGHIMHLFLLRVPAMDRFYHLHPVQSREDTFAAELPNMEAGHYQIFADIVRESGFPETMVRDLELPEVTGKPLAGDDSEATASPFGEASMSGGKTAALPDGARMVWQNGDTHPIIDQLNFFRFRILDGHGNDVSDLEPYMGMAGHAVFVRSDRQVLAHVHPAGSIPMAALDIVQKDASIQLGSGHQHSGSIPSEVAFPYGFPQSGDYRIFVQIKRAGKIETGVFDTHVSN
jgi:hypothetical protein